MIDPTVSTSSEQPPRRRWVAMLAAVVVAAGAGAGVAVWQHGSAPAAPGAASSASASVAPAAAVLPRPASGAALSERQAWVAQEVTATMKEQTRGLLDGDPVRFEANSLPSAKGDLGRRFRSLRSLRVTRFEQRIDGQPFLEKDGRWRVVHVVDHCLVEATCPLDEAIFDSLWRETKDGVRLAGFRKHDLRSACWSCSKATRVLSRPWETTELVARVGARTVVAVPVGRRNRLAALSEEAEAAAATADRYTVGAGRVLRYRVFVADSAGWRNWYSGFPGKWVAGRAIVTGLEQIDVAVNVADLRGDFTGELLTHELAHVSTLRTNGHYGRGYLWWLIEGMAEHVQQNGAAPSAYEGRDDLRDFTTRRTLRSVVIDPPARNGTLGEAHGRYAVGYYALNHLFTSYGAPATLKFFEQAVQQGVGLDTAARNAFGKPWAAVDRECVAALRKV